LFDFKNFFQKIEIRATGINKHKSKHIKYHKKNATFVFEVLLYKKLLLMGLQSEWE